MNQHFQTLVGQRLQTSLNIVHWTMYQTIISVKIVFISWSTDCRLWSNIFNFYIISTIFSSKKSIQSLKFFTIRSLYSLMRWKINFRFGTTWVFSGKKIKHTFGKNSTRTLIIRRINRWNFADSNMILKNVFWGQDVEGSIEQTETKIQHTKIKNDHIWSLYTMRIN